MAVRDATIKKYLQIDLGGFLKKYNFKAINIRGDIYFINNESKIGYYFAAQVLNSGLTINSGSIYYHKVEQIIADIANYEIFEYDGYKLAKTLRLFYPQTSTIVESEDDFYRIISEFEISFTDYYLPTFERYSDPKNVLELWDSLDDKGKSNHFFSPHKNIKIMILSKMCNDEHYERRCQEAIDFYTMHYNNGIESAKELIDNCHKVIKYLKENEV